jgi:glycosyltransferase A (GT-A) superfamily protein (DUF2064 family)
MLRRQLAIFARAPELGRVKRRLAAGLGWVAATAFYRAAAPSLARRLGADRRWFASLWLTPDRAVGMGRIWPGHLPRMRQGRGDLGRRMARVFSELPPGPVVLVGCDIPEIAPAHIAHAFALLGDHDAVFGPARDGGYWLVGLKRRPRLRLPFAPHPPLRASQYDEGGYAGGRASKGVRWSSRFTLVDTLANLQGARVAFLDPLSDIDTSVDYKAWRRRAEAGR